MQKVVVIGGGPAGIEAAAQLSSFGVDVTLIEKGNRLGGHVYDWAHLFPDNADSTKLVNSLLTSINNKIHTIFGTEIFKSEKIENGYLLSLTDGQTLEADAVLIATGYSLFEASRKEEYGYGIYDNVITSADFEQLIKNGNKLKTLQGKTPARVAFIHCVGSRDEKAGNRSCSKVCCITAIKQAIVVKETNPDAEVFCLYMDLRMYDRYFENWYLEAQKKGVIFIRGRLSEAAENKEGDLVLKLEDTLAARPLKMTVDMMVLMIGMTPSVGTKQQVDIFNLTKAEDGFLKPADNHLKANITEQKGIFITGTCAGPKSVVETLNDARSASLSIMKYLTAQKKEVHSEIATYKF
jgi:heterodisulfide reductase subunit A